MCHYGAGTPKPHYAYGNSPAVSRLWRGKFGGENRKRLDALPAEVKKRLKTCETYVNSEGAACFKGTGNLQKTEILGNWSLQRFFILHKNWPPKKFRTVSGIQRKCHSSSSCRCWNLSINFSDGGPQITVPCTDSFFPPPRYGIKENKISAGNENSL